MILIMQTIELNNPFHIVQNDTGYSMYSLVGDVYLCHGLPAYYAAFDYDYQGINELGNLESFPLLSKFSMN